MPGTQSGLFLHTSLSPPQVCLPPLRTTHTHGGHTRGQPHPSPLSCRVLSADGQNRCQAQPTKWPFRALIFLPLKEEEGQYSHTG